jgi:NADPH-dependent ferric siderophore reductase
MTAQPDLAEAAVRETVTLVCATSIDIAYKLMLIGDRAGAAALCALCETLEQSTDHMVTEVSAVVRAGAA